MTATPSAEEGLTTEGGNSEAKEEEGNAITTGGTAEEQQKSERQRKRKSRWGVEKQEETANTSSSSGSGEGGGNSHGTAANGTDTDGVSSEAKEEGNVGDTNGSKKVKRSRFTAATVETAAQAPVQVSLLSLPYSPTHFSSPHMYLPLSIP